MHSSINSWNVEEVHEEVHEPHLMAQKILVPLLLPNRYFGGKKCNRRGPRNPNGSIDNNRLHSDVHSNEN